MTPTIESERPSVPPANNGASSRAFPKSWRETIAIPRWVVYFQAALLGLLATTFFIFGLMVGSLTSGSTEVNATFDCRVLGSVVYRTDDGDLRADDGAVVFILPRDKKPNERSAGAMVNPDTFKALDNNAIDQIHDLGGAVVRADDNGQFDVVVDGNYSDGVRYFLLIVSKNVRGKETSRMTKEQVASIGQFFMPVEDVVDDRSFYWMPLSVNEERLDLPEIEF